MSLSVSHGAVCAVPSWPSVPAPCWQQQEPGAAAGHAPPDCPCHRAWVMIPGLELLPAHSHVVHLGGGVKSVLYRVVFNLFNLCLSLQLERWALFFQPHFVNWLNSGEQMEGNNETLNFCLFHWWFTHPLQSIFRSTWDVLLSPALCLVPACSCWYCSVLPTGVWSAKSWRSPDAFPLLICLKMTWVLSSGAVARIMGSWKKRNVKAEIYFLVFLP